MKTDIDFPLTDAGNAELFAYLYRDLLRFDHRRKKWLVWRGNWWAEDMNAEVRRLAVQAARARLAGAAPASGSAKDEEAAQWALKSESRYRLDAALELAKSELPLADDGDDWNKDPWLLGVANGVVDLRTGDLRDGGPEDKITYRTNIVYDPAARSPRWEQFLLEVFEGDLELTDFVQRAIGYSSTGKVDEQCLFLCYGTGSNGKSTLLEALRFVLGDYAYNLPFSAFEIKARASISNDVAALVGRRFVSAVETNEDAQLNEARIKALTGGDKITARFLYGEFFSFYPMAKFWLAFNHKPQVRDDSYGFWRRIRLLPFVQVFNRDGADKPDKELLEKLRAEAPGILRWTVQGSLAWQQRGLDPPAKVQAATESYRQESDPVGRFVDECCDLAADGEVTSAELRDRSKQWAEENGESRISPNKLAVWMKRRGLKPTRIGPKQDRGWSGIRLRNRVSANPETFDREGA